MLRENLRPVLSGSLSRAVRGGPVYFLSGDAVRFKLDPASGVLAFTSFLFFAFSMSLCVTRPTDDASLSSSSFHFCVSFTLNIQNNIMNKMNKHTV